MAGKQASQSPHSSSLTSSLCRLWSHLATHLHTHTCTHTPTNIPPTQTHTWQVHPRTLLLACVQWITSTEDSHCFTLNVRACGGGAPQWKDMTMWEKERKKERTNELASSSPHSPYCLTGTHLFLLHPPPPLPLPPLPPDPGSHCHSSPL